MPGIFKDGNPLVSLIKGKAPSLGFGSQMDKQFLPSPFDDWFKSAETLDAERNKGDRSAEKAKLVKDLDLNMFEGETEDEQIKNRDKEIRRRLDTDLPTPNKLKKLEMTRDEYEESIKSQQW